MRESNVVARHFIENRGRLARYLSQHTLTCLTRQGAAELIRQVHAATLVQERRVLLNMQEGKMLIEIEVSDRTELDKWFVAQKLDFDWILRIEFESVDGDLHSVF
jgi:hypothetical protein